MTGDPLDILPFRFLSTRAREQLRARLHHIAWPADTRIVQKGEVDDSRIFLLTQGCVVARKKKDGTANPIQAGHFFGERPALFGTPRAVNITTTEPSEAYWFDGRALLPYLKDEPAFAHALTFIVRDKLGMFIPMDRFLSEVRLGASRGHLVLAKILRYYSKLEPALHRGLHDKELDLNALSYAVRRLPTNVTQTFVWFAADELPPRYLAARGLFRETTAAHRRRTTLEMLPGKSMLTLRDGLSDLLDLVTCLCIYAIEARKLRRRVQEQQLDSLDETLLSDAEREALEALWPGKVPERMLEMVLHHEDITVHTYRRTNNYNSANAERWIRQVADATRDLLGSDPRGLPDDFQVHVISSNTHSVTNCLSPWIPENAEDLIAWGQIYAPDIIAGPWHDPSDRLVALVRPFLAAHPDRRAEKTARDRAVRVQLDETAFTGIRVQLFHLAQLEGLQVDPCLPEPKQDGLIVNIDYAFGQQAEPLIANLVHLFGTRIRSINVLGKAGGLQGKRGDVLVADAFVNQRDDVMLRPKTAHDVESLQVRLPDREVHQGPVLTVLGTILQNDRLLHYYRHLWGCVGLEMEGSYYCRQALECRELGMLRPDVALRFLYYISDLPLAHGESLSAQMTVQEGIPPLYAITREILTDVLSA